VKERSDILTKEMRKTVKRIRLKADVKAEAIYIYDQIEVSDGELERAFGPRETLQEQMIALDAEREAHEECNGECNEECKGDEDRHETQKGD